MFGLRMALAIGAAELSFRYIEQPIRNGALGRYWAHLRTADGWRRWQVAGRARWSSAR